MKCPHCGQTDGQVKSGHNTSGSQRYQCTACHRKYTPEPTHHGYPEAVRRQAIQLYVDGINLRRIGRIVGLTHQTVSNWVNAYAATLPPPPPLVPGPQQVNELDELYTFVGTKKNASMSSRKSTERRGVSSDGRLPSTGSKRQSKRW
jgi:transposase-like protein